MGMGLFKSIHSEFKNASTIRHMKTKEEIEVKCVSNLNYNTEMAGYSLTVKKKDGEQIDLLVWKDGGFLYTTCKRKEISSVMIDEKPSLIIEKHYKDQGIDTFKRLEANSTHEEIKGFIKGNIDKYNWRSKGQDRYDYIKIIRYAEFGLRMLDKKESNES